jgi:hypothetical protein
MRRTTIVMRAVPGIGLFLLLVLVLVSPIQAKSTQSCIEPDWKSIISWWPGDNNAKDINDNPAMADSGPGVIVRSRANLLGYFRASSAAASVAGTSPHTSGC